VGGVSGGGVPPPTAGALNNTKPEAAKKSDFIIQATIFVAEWIFSLYKLQQ
jgi:hypothetical protein